MRRYYLCVISQKGRVVQRQLLSRMRTLFPDICAGFLVDVCFSVSLAVVVTTAPLVFPCDNDVQMDLTLETNWIPHEDSFLEASVKGWEEEAHASEQQLRSWSMAGKTPVLGLGMLMDYPDRDFFAHLTRTESGDESESVCESHCAPKPVNSDYVPCGTYKLMDDGWNASRDSPPVPPGLRSTPQSSWQPYPDANASKGSWVFRRFEIQPNELTAGMPLVIEPPDERAPSKPNVLEVVHLNRPTCWH